MTTTCYDHLEVPKGPRTQLVHPIWHGPDCPGHWRKLPEYGLYGPWLAPLRIGEELVKPSEEYL